MAEIELVIKIPEDVYKKTVFYREFRDLNDCVTTIKALEKAVELPKGHGRLIDESAIREVYIHETEPKEINGMTIIPPRIEIAGTDAPTIIEADAESEEQYD